MVPRMSVVRRPSQGSPVSFKRRPRKKAAPSSEPCRICSARKATRLLPTPTRHRASRQKPLINYVKTHMVEFAAQRPQARFYVAKAIPVSELGKGHRQILIPTREASRSRISAVPSDTTAKLAIRQETQQLGEHRAALVHEPCRTPQSWSLEPVAVQIAARQISSQTADGQGLIRLCKVLYRTLVLPTIEAPHGARLRSRELL